MNKQDITTLKDLQDNHELIIDWPTPDSLRKNMDEIDSGWPNPDYQADRETNPNYEGTDYGPPFFINDFSLKGILNLAELITTINRLEYSISDETILFEAMKMIRPIVEANNYNDLWITELFWQLMSGIEHIHQLQIDFFSE